MNLEDHLGDILRKARRAAGVPAEVVARTIGLSSSAYAALEESGRVESRIPLNRVAPLLGLDAIKLEGIAAGWRPRTRDLAQWRHLEMVATTEGGNTVNAFLVWDPSTREAALFDTGWEARPLLELLERHALCLRSILLTHSHHDHVAGLETLRRAVPAAQVFVGGGPSEPHGGLVLGQLRISRQPVGGHAEDGVIYVVRGWFEAAPAVAVVGDTLFAGSIASGFISWEVLKHQVREHILVLPAETLICPGHGPVTTVAEEWAHNPFFGPRGSSPASPP